MCLFLDALSLEASFLGRARPVLRGPAANVAKYPSPVLILDAREATSEASSRTANIQVNTEYVASMWPGHDSEEVRHLSLVLSSRRLLP